ncbi:MAG TPA: RIP metalloprotease RseP [Longimicrobiaceae bacterium]|nr:RIP metalloprotease RseP [Longimicrobiaceae bacterium]
MLSIIAFFVVISILIFVHELGHFLAAKSVDVQVPRFSIGLGPRVVGFRRGETEYVLSAIPLGGYVKMAGMEDDEAAEALEGGTAAPDEAPVDPERTFDAKPLWARAWIISAGVIFNMIFAFLVYTGLGLAYGEAKVASTRVAVVGADTMAGPAATLARIPAGAEVQAVGQTRVEDWSELREALAAAPAGPVTLRLAAAPPVTVELPADEMERARALARVQPFAEPVIGEVVEGRPADQAGLRAGDRVLEAAGEPVQTWQDLESAIRSSPGEPLPLVVQRGDQRVAVTVTPETERELDAEMKRVPVGKIGVATPRPDVVQRTLGPAEAVSMGWRQTWAAAGAIVEVLGRLVTGAESMRSLGGPLAIGQISGETARLGLQAFLSFLAIFSINLAIFNLLPIPILDGGHLLFIGIEAVRGRPLSLEQRVRLSHVGMIFVIGLMVWAITNDILRVVFNI